VAARDQPVLILLTERHLHRSCSGALPLHEGLIVATNREETLVVGGEHGADDVLGVTTVRSGLSTLSAWVTEEANETEVITSSEELSISGAADAVDVSTIGTLGVDALSLPLELASLGCPDGAGGVRSAVSILSAFGDGVEEELVGTAVGADVFAVVAPVQGHDVRVVSRALADEGEVLSGVVDVDIVVVGADSKILVVWRESHNLDPLSGVLDQLDLSVRGGSSPD